MPAAEHDYSGFRDSTKEEGSNILAAISVEVRRLKDAEKLVEERDLSLKEATAAVRELSEKTLPELMVEAKQKSLTTEDGYVAELVEKIRAGISKERAPEAHGWLNDNGHSNLIKKQLVAEFDRTDLEKVKKLSELAAELGIAFTVKQSVHPGTLEKFVREALENGEDIPRETFGVYEQRFVRAELPKEKRSKGSAPF